MNPMNAKELFQAGRLQNAIDALSTEIKARPTDFGSRAFLCELLCFAGQIERADKQLDALSQLQPDFAVGVALFRQLLRAAMHRHQCFTEGRLPEFVAKPSETLQRHLAALVELRGGDPAIAERRLTEGESLRVRPVGVCDGQPFDDLRDLDDLLAPILEVFTADGRYFWIEWSQLIRLDLKPIEHPRDLLWRPAQIVVEGGPHGAVFVPALYPGSEASSDDTRRLGRATDWEKGPGELVRGVGQRMLLIGEESCPFHELKQISIKPAKNDT
jgi:type VI secretion system protein ImpE